MKNKKGKNYSDLPYCTFCKSSMKILEDDKRNLPTAIRLEYPYACENCVREMNTMLALVEEERTSREYAKAYQPNMKTVQQSKKVDVKLSTEQSQSQELTYNVIVARVKQFVVGQNSAVDTFCTAMYKNMMLKGKKKHILIIGDTGTGKTMLIEEFAKVVNKPFVIEDATQYTETGYVGECVEGMLKNLYYRAGADLERAQNGIVIVDEIDKKAGVNDSTNRDVSGRSVLQSMLKMLEGSVVQVSIGKDDSNREKKILFDTSNVVFVFLGAFPGMQQIRDKRIGRKAIGFATTYDKSIEIENFIPEDLVEFGMLNEFIGRISCFVTMKQLEEEDLFNILKHSKKSILKNSKDEFKQFGVNLIVADDVVREIVKKAVLLKTGARALNVVVEQIMEAPMREVFSRSSMNKPAVCQIQEGITVDNECYAFN